MSNTRIVEVGDNELTVSEEAYQHYFFRDPQPVTSAALKCGGCNLLTVHEGFAIEGRPLYQAEELMPVSKRIYGCTNCGRISTK